MSVQRQEGSQEHGRVNQKRRTRAALVDAAKALIAEGITPTVAQAAEVALVSRTTAYRYFPTQESLLVELSMNVDVDDIEALVAEPVDAATAAERVVAIVERFNEHVAAEEVQYRSAMRLYQDQWLDAVAAGDATPVVREGRRTRWFADSLAPLADTVPAEALERLVAALSLVAGPEPMVVLRDVCGLDHETGRSVTEWLARVAIEATLAER